ncbi:MAG: DUF3035 domain-containing protein [Hellea sp.]|nr:DUF3035 domain-containing protein [Hellea sp.]
MSMRKILGLSALIGFGVAMSGCASASKALGLKQSAPNEFNILTKAPLVVPPEYNLRPPRAGESSYENNYTQKAAREALVGEIDSAEPSQGEMYLMGKAGAPRANPEIRVEIDGQNSVERKTTSFSEAILGANAPLDPEAEAKRLNAINAATGGGQVEITRKPGSAKLPGL